MVEKHVKQILQYDDQIWRSRLTLSPDSTTVIDSVEPRLSRQRHSRFHAGVFYRQPDHAYSDDQEEDFHEAIRRMNNFRFTSNHGDSLY